ncbi:MAG: sulfotransferase [Actinomycetota bacterium]|nr:sulfotransferase [Actinomycetota bacterium]
MRSWGQAGRRLEPVQVLCDFAVASAASVMHRRDFDALQRFVMFVGYPRSGHSIIGSLLNAHPHVVIAHRVPLLRYVAAGFRRHQLLGMALVADRRFERMGRVASKRYDYSVPNQWQGRFSELRAIGYGHSSTRWLARRPELLDQLRDAVALPVSLVHVMRNPFDNISTISVRNRLSLSDAADDYFRRCATVEALRSSTPAGQWLDIRHEDFVAQPEHALGRLCEFLALDADDRWLGDAASIVYDRPHRSRYGVAWSDELLADVHHRMEAYPFLDGYAYDEPSLDAAPSA